ncbi:hypothetical protein J6590_042008, partial [Homalodisca vitripennis]
MFNSNANNDSESIDYEFFESEGSHVKMYGELKQNDCSKIVTKAIIETNPSKLDEFGGSLQNSKRYFKRKSIYNEEGDQCKIYNNQFSYSPSSSVEKTFIDGCLDESLLNCLAYNEDNYENQDSFSCLSDDKECSNNSLSESTITSVTSDFTSVSLFSCLSDSSCITDASLDSSTPQNDTENYCTENVSTSNYHEHQDNGIKNVSNESLKENDQLHFEKCIEVKENHSLKDEYVNEEKFEDGLENHYNENCEQIRDDDNFESEQVQRSPISDSDEESDENDNDNCVEKNNESDNENWVEKPISVDNDSCENSNNSICYESDYETESIKENENTSEKNSNISVLEEELEDISLTTQLSSKSLSLRSPLCRSLNKIRARRKECNLSFSREELIKIERDNLTLLKKIMAHAKPRTVSLNQPFSHKKTSAAINRAKQQKKIDQDNY